MADRIIASFEDCTLPAAAFGHREHVYCAWGMLRESPFEVAAPRFVNALRRFAATHGAASKFHATLTWAWLAMLDEALDESRDVAFEDLLARRPELNGMGPAMLYAPDVLASERARRAFVLPRSTHPSRT